MDSIQYFTSPVLKMNQAANHHPADMMDEHTSNGSSNGTSGIEEALREAYDIKMKLVTTVVSINNQLVAKLKEKDDEIDGLSNLNAELQHECAMLKETLKLKENLMETRLQEMEDKLTALLSSVSETRRMI